MRYKRFALRLWPFRARLALSWQRFTHGTVWLTVRVSVWKSRRERARISRERNYTMRQWYREEDRIKGIVAREKDFIE